MFDWLFDGGDRQVWGKWLRVVPAWVTCTLHNCSCCSFGALDTSYLIVISRVMLMAVMMVLALMTTGRQAGRRQGGSMRWGWQTSCTGADSEQSLLDTSFWRPPACHSPIGVSEMIIRVGFINDKVKFKRQHNPLNATIFPLQSFSDASNLVSISQLFAPLMTIITFQLSVCRHCNQHMAIGQSLHLTARISLTNTNDSNNQRQSYLKHFGNWSSRYCIRHKSSLEIQWVLP